MIPEKVGIDIIKEGYYEPSKPWRTYEQDLATLEAAGWITAHVAFRDAIHIFMYRSLSAEGWRPAGDTVERPGWIDRLLGRTWTDKIRAAHHKMIQECLQVRRESFEAERVVAEVFPPKDVQP